MVVFLLALDFFIVVAVANNGKGSTINPSREIRTTDNLLSKLSNQQAQNIKEQYEAQIEAPIKTGDCRIM